MQVQQKLDQAFTAEDAVLAAKNIGRYPEVDIDEKDSSIVYLNFFTEEPQQFWDDFKGGVLNHDKIGTWLKSVSIIVCEGENGWNDEKLLHHYDDSEPLDSSP